MLELWCRTQTGSIPRGKDLLGQVAHGDPALGTLARTVFSDSPFSERLTAAIGVANLTIGARGFFEWDSGAEPVPPPRT